MAIFGGGRTMPGESSPQYRHGFIPGDQSEWDLREAWKREATRLFGAAESRKAVAS